MKCVTGRVKMNLFLMKFMHYEIDVKESWIILHCLLS
jgi:hypothetical protein